MPAPWGRQSRKATSLVTAPIPNLMEVKADAFQTIYAEIRDNIRTDHTVPARRTDMGRAYWQRTGPGEELATDGVRLPRFIGGFGGVRHLAIVPEPYRSLCRGGR